MVSIALLGTCDTKLEEFLYLRQQILDQGDVTVTLIDVGRKSINNKAIAIKQDEVMSYVDERPDLSNLPRGDVIKHMIKCATACVKSLFGQGRINAILSAGGSGGTSLAAAVMRESLPIGLPKLIVSTVASGDTRSLVGESDISLMYSVVDIAGSNSLLKTIFTNAAGAIVGMAKAYEKRASALKEVRQETKKRVGVTMFGVTTPSVDAIRQRLESRFGYEVFVFHATGTGGRAMERLVNEKVLDAVLDLTTTEICDQLMGGNMSAGPNRLEATAKAGLPYVLSLGATDMVNFGPITSVPSRYEKGRQLFEHNPTVTLMRTSKQECKQIGEFIVEKLKMHASKPELVKVVLPRGGVSMISTPGGPFADSEADEALFKAVEDGLVGTEIAVVEDPRDVNDTGFAEDIADTLARLMGAEV